MLDDKYITKAITLGIVAFLLFAFLMGAASVSAETPVTVAEGEVVKATPTAQAEESGNISKISDDRIRKIEDLITKAEIRSYENKMMARELIRYVKIMVTALVVIALGFPLTVWLLSKKRILGLSGLSQEVSATLLVVEERQAKLANILKEIQGEIDYVHSMSVPDLKNLIKQAELYLQQNERDLAKNVRNKQ
jgi:hypothetical protein